MTSTFNQRFGSDASRAPAAKEGGVECLCPFCGAFHSDIGRPCRHCGTEDTTAARGAARKRVGPWFVLQTKNPAAPGMTLQSLLALIRGGLVTDRSVIRGPATGQLWRLAGKVRGISREFGSCYGCNGDLYAGDALCPHCQRPQSLPADIDAAAEPAPAAVTERRPPREDLLTPRDVAKAFSLGYGPGAQTSSSSPVLLSDLLPPGNAPTGRPKPTVFAALTVVAAVACFSWVLIHSLGGRRATPAIADAEPILPPASRTVVSPAPVVSPPQVSPSTVSAFVEQPTLRQAMLLRQAPAVAPVAVARKPVLPHPVAEEPTTITTIGSELAPSDPQTDDPRRLMAAGLNAEARGDYASAVKQYERIESLSSAEWPAGLKDRLSLARSAARGD